MSTPHTAGDNEPPPRACGRLPGVPPSAAGYQALAAGDSCLGNTAGSAGWALADRILAAARAPLPTVASEAANTRDLVGSPIRRLIAAAASILAVITVGVISRMTIDRARPRRLVRNRSGGLTEGVAGLDPSSPRLNEALASADRGHLGPRALGVRAGREAEPAVPRRRDRARHGTASG